MAVQPVVLIDGVQITNAWVTYYTSPAGSGQTLVKILKCAVTNTDGSNSHWFSISIGPNGTAGKTTIIQRGLAPNETQDVPEIVNLLLSGGTAVQMEADAGAVLNVHASGVAIT